MESESFRELIFNGKNYNIKVIIIEQLLIMPTVLLNEFDQIFLLRDCSIDNTKRIYDKLGLKEKYPNFDACSKEFSEMTEDYKSYVVTRDKEIKWYRVDLEIESPPKQTEFKEEILELEEIAPVYTCYDQFTSLYNYISATVVDFF